MLRLGLIVAGAALVLFTTTIAGDARACGAYFVRPQENTVVIGHRMALSISKAQTVLWDQIRYSGNPKEFSWVLPVRPGARVEIANDEFFGALEASTAPIVYGPVPTPRNRGVGCGSAPSSSFSAGGSTDPGVNVIRQEVVGPYEVATLAATDPAALTKWLTAHGYVIPSFIEPVIASYVVEKMDFVAMRLVPHAGVAAMRPVRVVTPGASPVLPLRMVAAGTGAKASLVLYVIGEGRWEAANFPNLAIDESDLEWDPADSRSNYAELSNELLESEDGRGWLTETAIQANWLLRPGSSTLDSAYAAAVATHPCSYFNPFGDGGDLFPVIDASRLDDAEPASDAGDPSDASAIEDGGSDASDAGSSSKCPAFDDLELATSGMRPADVWVTRLVANLPRAALSSDLQLRAAPQSVVSGIYYLNEEGSGCTIGGRVGAPEVCVVAIGAIATLLLRRRRR